jgi:rSAM/selenodomain-associated transferase 2
MNGLDQLCVIIPVLDRQDELASTLPKLPRTGQVIVVDGGSSDHSADVALGAGATLVRSRAGRGHQMSVGAQRATAEWLLFLHADTRVDEQGWRAVGDYIADASSAARAATFRFALDDPSWQARLLALGVRARVALLALPYGDQGLLIHRSLYDSVGGFADVPIMEDVDLVRRLGRGRLSRLPGTAVTSAERWRRRGWLRQSAFNLLCLARFALGASPQSIAKLYGR